jgi:hypothetical protein
MPGPDGHGVEGPGAEGGATGPGLGGTGLGGAGTLRDTIPTTVCTAEYVYLTDELLNFKY